MTRIFLIVFGILVLALVASGLTEAALVIGRPLSVSVEPKVPATPKPVTPASPTVAPTPAPAPVTPAPAAVPLPTATVNGFVHMRADRSTAAVIITDLYAGNTVQYTQVDAGLWQAVIYQGQNGFVYKTYLNY